MENNEKRSRFALVRMIKGLAQPANTRDYKEARIALERLSAPIVAVLIPVLAAVVLAVVTAMKPRTVSVMEIQLADLDVDDPVGVVRRDEGKVRKDRPLPRELWKRRVRIAAPLAHLFPKTPEKERDLFRDKGAPALKIGAAGAFFGR